MPSSAEGAGNWLPQFRYFLRRFFWNVFQNFTLPCLCILYRQPLLYKILILVALFHLTDALEGERLETKVLVTSSN